MSTSYTSLSETRRRIIYSTKFAQLLVEKWLNARPKPCGGVRLRGRRALDNLARLEVELSAEQLKSLDGASRIELGFPQSIYEKESVRAVRYGGVWDRLLV
jgi:hypothetical protein